MSIEKNSQILETECPICGRKLTITMTQLIIATKKKGRESVCLQCEFSPKLKEYIENNGGNVSVKEAIYTSECSLIKQLGQPLIYDGKCEGFCKSNYDDEPCEQCKECPFNVFYEE